MCFQDPLPRPSPGEAGRVGEAERDEFYGFLEKLLLKIRDVSEKPGKVLIIPCSLVGTFFFVDEL